MATAADGRDGERPFVIEIAGVAGAGKSTLAANLAASLVARGYAAADSRSTRRGGYGFGDRFAARLRALPEAVTASAFVARRILSRELPAGALSRLGPAFQHSRQRQLLARRLGAAGVIVQEPGWLMDLLTQYVHARRDLDAATALRFISAGPAIDLAVFLRAGADTALRHMNSRKRGLPKSFRALDPAALADILRRGDAAAATIAGACRQVGIATLEIDVDGLDADAVTARCLDFVAAALARRRGQAAASD